MWGAGFTGNVDAVRSWVASGADINVAALGVTPLMWASFIQHAECVAELLRLGADATRVDNAGRTALHLFSERGREESEGMEVVRLLVAAGCDAAACDNDGNTVGNHGSASQTKVIVG